jgi:hypothetical protein
MPRFNVRVQRTMIERVEIAVEAVDEEAAEAVALEQCTEAFDRLKDYDVYKEEVTDVELD